MLLATPLSVISHLVFHHLLSARNTEMKVLRLTASSYISISDQLCLRQGGNGHFALKIKLLFSSSQCPSPCTSSPRNTKLVSVESTWWILVRSVGSYAEMCSTSKETASFLQLMNWTLGICCTERDRGACSGSRPETPRLVERGWRTTAWVRGPGVIQEREDEGFKGSSWW